MIYYCHTYSGYVSLYYINTRQSRKTAAKIRNIGRIDSVSPLSGDRRTTVRRYGRKEKAVHFPGHRARRTRSSVVGDEV